MNPILDFIINQVFGQGAIFISLIALVGLILQKKEVSEIVRGGILSVDIGQKMLCSLGKI